MFNIFTFFNHFHKVLVCSSICVGSACIFGEFLPILDVGDEFCVDIVWITHHVYHRLQDCNGI